MLRPRQRNKHAHQCKIDIDLLSFSQIISVRVRLEWSVSNAFDEKFAVAFEKEFRDRANSRVCAHSGNFLVQAPRRRKVFGRDDAPYLAKLGSTSRTTAPVRSMSSDVCAVEIKPVSNCDGAK